MTNKKPHTVSDKQSNDWLKKEIDFEFLFQDALVEVEKTKKKKPLKKTKPKVKSKTFILTF